MNELSLNTQGKMLAIIIIIINFLFIEHLTRITNFLKEHQVLSKNQIGFLPNHRTSDHIFTLHTLIDQYVNQNKGKIFACFVDFQKAFDSIWHNGLFYKLIESGGGNV